MLLSLRMARDTSDTYLKTVDQTLGRMTLTQQVLSRVYDLANKVKQGIATVNNPEAQAAGPSSIPVKTLALNWLQPHEGNIIDFLFRQRAFQDAPPPAH